MTAASLHPADEELGRFVEGSLDPNGRARVVGHLADCDECRMIVVDSAELIEEPRADRRWWLAIAAGLLLVIAGGMFTYNQHRDPLEAVVADYAQLKERPIDARLSGFRHIPRHVMRGSGGAIDPSLLIMQGKALEVTELAGTSPRILHARGVALLLDGRVDDAITALVAAATRDPRNAKYQSDVAAALIANARRDPQKLETAIAMCDRALQVDAQAPEALFNRALALDRLGRNAEAIAAYDRYIAVDPSSPWGVEAADNRKALTASLPPR